MHYSGYFTAFFLKKTTKAVFLSALGRSIIPVAMSLLTVEPIQPAADGNANDVLGEGFADVGERTWIQKGIGTAAYILNLAGGEGTAETEDVSHATVKYWFADGNEVEIPMYIPLAAQDNNMEAGTNQAIWIVDTAHWNTGAQ